MGLVRSKHILHFACLAFYALALSGVAVAAPAPCSPGIPCTTYTVDTQTDAGTNPSYNGPKTGEPAPHTTGSCDGNFMNQIYAKAFLQASRQVIMSEQLIRKPDSVLEYTCFDQFLAKTAHTAGPIFSESTAYQNRSVTLRTKDGTSNYTINAVFSNTRLDNVLNLLVVDSLRNYINSNFGHTFLGGSTSIDNNMNLSGIAANNYNCSHMSTVWNIAKCSDFGEDDKFRSFSTLASSDPRALPAACSNGAVSPSSNGYAALEAIGVMTLDYSTPCPASTPAPGNLRTGMNSDLIRVSNNCDYQYSDFDIIDPSFSRVKSRGTTPAQIAMGHPALCSSPIPTGVLVETFTTDEASSPIGMQALTPTRYVHYEHICPNPGCYYAPIQVLAPDPNIIPPLPDPPGVCLNL